jgi:predicted lipoprotein with Yx(FWY)xxD motif
MRSTLIRSILLAALAALVLAQCSSSSKAASPTTSPATTTPAAAPTTGPKPPTTTATTVAIRTTKLGRVLVNRKGRTLYIYEKDTRAGISACTGVCATAWPPVVVTAVPVYGRGLRASMFSTIIRKGAKKQLAYNGKPLYAFRGDTAAGQTNGQGVGSFRVALVK